MNPRLAAGPPPSSGRKHTIASRLDLAIDISDAIGLDAHLSTAVSVYLPQVAPPNGSPPVLFAFPGGTYGRCYYDFQPPGRAGYSFAERLTEHGYLVVACDHIGIGDSTPHEPFAELTKDVVVQADRATVAGVLDRLATGTLTAGLAPIPDPFTIGVGHSMGAYLLSVQQARYRSFDAVALLGWTVPDLSNLGSGREWAACLAQMPDPTRPPRTLLHGSFHNEAVPDEVIRADDTLAVRVYTWMFQPQEHGLRRDRGAARAAQQIDVPLFLGFGGRDVATIPRREPQYYPLATDITTFVLPEAGHCFNHAPGRRRFFDRLAAWGNEVARVRTAPAQETM